MQLYASRAASLLEPVQSASLVTVVPKHEQPREKHLERSAPLCSQSTQLLLAEHERTIVTRSRVDVLHARLTCATLPLSAFMEVLYGAYAL